MRDKNFSLQIYDKANINFVAYDTQIFAKGTGPLLASLSLSRVL